MFWDAQAKKDQLIMDSTTPVLQCSTVQVRNYEGRTEMGRIRVQSRRVVCFGKIGFARVTDRRKSVALVRLVDTI